MNMYFILVTTLLYKVLLWRWGFLKRVNRVFMLGLLYFKLKHIKTLLSCLLCLWGWPIACKINYNIVWFQKISIPGPGKLRPGKLRPSGKMNEMNAHLQITSPNDPWPIRSLSESLLQSNRAMPSLQGSGLFVRSRGRTNFRKFDIVECEQKVSPFLFSSNLRSAVLFSRRERKDFKRGKNSRAWNFFWLVPKQKTILNCILISNLDGSVTSGAGAFFFRISPEISS